MSQELRVDDSLWAAVDRMIVDAWKLGGCEKTLDMLAMRARFEAALSAQPAPEFDVRKYIRHLADVLEAGVGLLKVDADLVRLGAAIQAVQPVQERQGEVVAWIDEFGNVYPLGAHSLAGKLSWQDAHKRNWRPLYTHPAAPVGVLDGWVLVPREPTEAMLEAFFEGEMSLGHDGYVVPSSCWAAMLAAAPSAPQGTQQGEGE